MQATHIVIYRAMIIDNFYGYAHWQVLSKECLKCYDEDIFAMVRTNHIPFYLPTLEGEATGSFVLPMG